MKAKKPIAYPLHSTEFRATLRAMVREEMDKARSRSAKADRGNPSPLPPPVR
jgi:hypothetical protein